MRRFIHVVLVTVLLVLSANHTPSRAQAETPALDLASIPVPVQSLPENGYQVLTGGYLNRKDAAELIAKPRNFTSDAVDAEVEQRGVAHTYVLDLVLPIDRADPNSEILAVVQTSVFHLDDENESAGFAEYLGNMDQTRFVTEMDPVVPDAITSGVTGSGGKLIRTTVAAGDVVIEVVSQDSTGEPDVTEHTLIVEATLARANAARSGSGVSPMVVTIADESQTPFAHANQSGVHGLYRYIDGALQPALGEMMVDVSVRTEPGLQTIYLGSQSTSTPGGISVFNTAIATFDSAANAEAFLTVLLQQQNPDIVDPYFTISTGETWQQTEPGIWRVTGQYKADRYSGIVQVRQVDAHVVMIGQRAIGTDQPQPAVLASLMDHQEACLQSSGWCAPISIAGLLPSATPITNGIGSTQFGWQLEPLSDDWKVTEQFSESGYDRISIQNGKSMFELESVVNHHGEPLQCVLDQLELLREFEEHSDIRVWEDPAGDAVGGNEPGHSWITYRVEPLAEERADQEYVIRIDCYALQPGTANLVVSQTAPVDLWPAEQAKGDELREHIVLPESASPRGMMSASTQNRRAMMIDKFWIDPAA